MKAAKPSAAEVRTAVSVDKLLRRLVAEYGDDALATTPIHEIAEWIAHGLTHPVRELTDWEVDALRAAVHAVAEEPCYGGRFEDCPDIWHTPAIDLSEWWPPMDATTGRLS